MKCFTLSLKCWIKREVNPKRSVWRNVERNSKCSVARSVKWSVERVDQQLNCELHQVTSRRIERLLDRWRKKIFSTKRSVTGRRWPLEAKNTTATLTLGSRWQARYLRERFRAACRSHAPSIPTAYGQIFNILTFSTREKLFPCRDSTRDDVAIRNIELADGIYRVSQRRWSILQSPISILIVAQTKVNAMKLSCSRVKCYINRAQPTLLPNASCRRSFTISFNIAFGNSRNWSFTVKLYHVTPRLVWCSIKMRDEMSRERERESQMVARNFMKMIISRFS